MIYANSQAQRYGFGWNVKFSKPLVLLDLLQTVSEVRVGDQHVIDQIPRLFGEASRKLVICLQYFLIKGLCILVFKGQITRE